jgi:integrase/recombinase XerD
MRKPPTPRAPPSFAALVQSFFTEHLTQQRAMSPRTVATYRDGFVLFLDFATAQLHKQPTTMALQDITSSLALAFLDHLEQDRQRGRHPQCPAGGAARVPEVRWAP